MRPGIFLLVVFTVLAAGAAVKVEHDQDVDFSKYRNYAWKEGAPALYPQIQEKIVEAVDRELAARGLVRVEGEADLYVMTYAFGEGAPKVSVDMGFWGGANEADGGGMGAPTSTVRVNTAGTLMVRLVDGQTEQPVWRALAEKTMSDKPSKALRKVDKVVTKMFADFPSGS
jgi:hypothetical protein